MNPQLAFELGKQRIRQIGYGRSFICSYRHITVAAKQTVVIKAQNQFWYLVEGFTSFSKIGSDLGSYDLTDVRLNENQHEHSGTIGIYNRGDTLLHLQFLVFTPRHRAGK
jgi:hypothetical protein